MAGNNSTAAVGGTEATVSGTVCSSLLTSFLSHFFALSPPSLARCYSITRLQDALTVSPFSSYTAVSEGAWKGSAQQAALCSA